MPDDKSGKKPGKSGAAKPPVIDLQARKVGEEKDTKPGKDEKPANTKPAATEKGKQPGKDKQSGEAGASKKPAEKPGGKAAEAPGKQKDKPQGKPAPAQEDTGGGKSRTGLKLLLGLLALGGAAGGGAWLYQQYGPEKAVQSLQQRLAAVEQRLSASERASALAGEVAALKNRLQQVQKEQAALAATVREMSKSDGGDLPVRVKALEENLAALEKLPAQVEELGKRTEALHKTVTALSQQMTTLKKTLDELASAAPAGGGAAQGAATGAAAGAGAGIAAAIAALKLSGQQLQQKIASLSEQLDEVRKGADPARFKALEARIAKQEEALIRAQEELRALAQRAEAAAEKAANQAKAALAAAEELKANPPVPKFTPPPQGVAYAALRQKVNAGQPYKAELGKLAALMPDAPGLDVLSRHSEKGVPSVEQLARQLAALKEQLSKAAKPVQPPATEDPLGALKGKLMQMVKVRRAGEADWPQTLAAAKAALREGGLAAALAQLTPYKDKLPEPVAQWAAQARARLAVDKAMAELADAVLKLSGAGGQ